MRGGVVVEPSPKASVLKELKINTKYIAFGGKKITPASHTLQIDQLLGWLMEIIRFKALFNYYLFSSELLK